MPTKFSKIIFLLRKIHKQSPSRVKIDQCTIGQCWAIIPTIATVYYLKLEACLLYHSFKV